MSNQATLNKLNHKIESMKREIDVLRSFAISIAGKDTEGEYRPEFVREILRAAKEKATFRFTTPKALLKDIEQAWSKSSTAKSFLNRRSIFQNHNNIN